MATTLLKDPTSARRRKAKAGDNGKQNGRAAGKAKVRPVALGDVGAASVPEGEYRPAAVGSIEVGPFNPRMAFAAAEIEEMAATMRVYGVLEPLLVRPLPADATRYELVAGERRLRAAKAAGLTRVPVRIVALTDRQCHEIAALENLQRKDLSAIEEARAYRTLLAGDDAPTQQQLGSRLGVSQGQIANRLRLLELPESVQARVISGEIPATHARELCRYKDHPELVEEMLATAIKDCGQEGGLPPAGRFAEDLGTMVRYSFGQELDSETWWDRKTGRRVPAFTPTPEQREQLQVIEVPCKYNASGTSEVALNKKLWDKLQAAHAKEWIKQKKGAKAKAKTKEDAKPDPEAEKRRAAEQARQFARRLYEWRCDWRRYLIAEAIDGVADDDLLRLALAAAACRWDAETGDRFRGAAEEWKAIAKADDPDALLRASLAACFWTDKDGPARSVSVSEVEAIAKHLGIDLSSAWGIEQAGPLSEAYWNLHTKDQLAALAQELFGAAVKEDPAFAVPPLPTKKSELVALLLSYRPAPDAFERGPLPLPKEIAKCKR